MRPIRSVVFAASALLASCASHETTRAQLFDDLPAASADTPVRVVRPADGAYADKVAAGSGVVVANRLVELLSARFRDVQAVDAAPVAASQRTLEITPELRHWEDRATNWSGISDKIRVQLRLRDLPTDKGRQLTFAAKSSWFTFVNAPPEDLLDGAFAAALDELLPARDDA